MNSNLSSQNVNFPQSSLQVFVLLPYCSKWKDDASHLTFSQARQLHDVEGGAGTTISLHNSCFSSFYSSLHHPSLLLQYFTSTIFYSREVIPLFILGEL